jgi:hypothetical protein
LKQGRHAELKASLDYFIERQTSNGFWKLPASGDARYLKAVDYIARSYGKMAALLEEEYIFNWLAWDGDNILADGAILDYGSIRQFAAKHDKYRYEDVDRYSASLTEQRYWARVLVQTFAQAVDFAISGTKKNLRDFKDAACLNVYDLSFQMERLQNALAAGVCARANQLPYPTRSRRDQNFRRALTYFEDLKVSKGIEKIADGITHWPIFLIRSLLRELPTFYLAQGVSERVERLRHAARYVLRDHGRILRQTKRQAADSFTHHARQNFQNCYRKLIEALDKPFDRVLKILQERSAVINHEHRMTGDAIVWIINEVINIKEKIEINELHEAYDAFIDSQILIPGKWQPVPPEQLTSKTLKSRLLKNIQANLEEFKNGFSISLCRKIGWLARESLYLKINLYEHTSSWRLPRGAADSRGRKR